MNDAQQKVLIEVSLRQLVTPLLKYPKDLEIQTACHHGKVVVDWNVNFADQGRVLGKQKVNFTAIRTLMDIIATKNGFTVRVNEISPAKVGQQEARMPETPDYGWKPTRITGIMREFLESMLSLPFQLEPESAGDWTTINLLLANNESLPVSPGQLAFSLGKIYHAIGRAQGRKIKINANVNDIAIKS